MAELTRERLVQIATDERGRHPEGAVIDGRCPCGHSDPAYDDDVWAAQDAHADGAVVDALLTALADDADNWGDDKGEDWYVVAKYADRLRGLVSGP